MFELMVSSGLDACMICVGEPVCVGDLLEVGVEIGVGVCCCDLSGLVWEGF